MKFINGNNTSKFFKQQNNAIRFLKGREKAKL